MTGPLPFLTALDPSDLPGGSIDPLGFERGYLLLAEKILPGLTNVANQPRYFSMLCAGALLAGGDRVTTGRADYAHRLEVVKRFERLWALANALAEDEVEEATALRGISYARARAGEIQKSGVSWTTGEYALLSRQVPYGAMGIYGPGADAMALWDRRSLSPSPDLGARLGEAFLSETRAPGAVKRAARDADEEVSVAALRAWGVRTHVEGATGAVEQACLREAVLRSEVRRRMLEVLAEVEWLDEESEQHRLGRALAVMAERGESDDLQQAITLILAYERCYQWAQLILNRLIWRCRRSPNGVGPEEVAADAVFAVTRDALPSCVDAVHQAREAVTVSRVREDLHRLQEVLRFLRQLRATPEQHDLVRCVMQRHADVQAGKLDRGRPKAPWLEWTRDRITLTLSQAGGTAAEPRSPDDVWTHPYRLVSADAFNVAAGLA